MKRLTRCEQRLAEAGVGVEPVGVVGDARDAREDVDPAVRFEEERPSGVADLEVADLLRELGLQVGHRIGTGDGDGVAIVIEPGGSHGASVWRATLGTAMAELDEIARRAVDSVERLATRAARFAGFVCIAALLIGTTSFALGLVALDGGIRTVWIVLGLAFGAMAVGKVVHRPPAAGQGEAPSR